MEYNLTQIMQVIRIGAITVFEYTTSPKVHLGRREQTHSADMDTLWKRGVHNPTQIMHMMRIRAITVLESTTSPKVLLGRREQPHSADTYTLWKRVVNLQEINDSP